VGKKLGVEDSRVEEEQKRLWEKIARSQSGRTLEQ
jgi:hypothetical protein